MRLSLVCLSVIVTACSAEPRASSYFVAHPEEAAKVADACRTGLHRGPECQNAEAGILMLKRDARTAGYKKAFE